MQSQSIGEFQTIKMISNSQYIQIYQAKNQNDGKSYTLKITDSQNSSLCEQEKEILKKLDSPRILKFIDLRLDQQYSLTILENFEYTLEEFWHQNNQKFSETMALEITKNILEGLEILKQNDIVHADLCMKNIYIKQHSYKIANFEYAHLNKKGLLKAENYYNAPEQFTPVQLGTETDIFSLGCMLFAMIFGYYPFSINNTSDYLLQIQQGQLQINNEIAQSESKFAIELIQKMVKYNPKKRPGILEIKKMIEKNNEKNQAQNPVFMTQTPQTNPALWGGINQNVIFETEHYTLEFVESVSKNALFFFDIAEKFGGKEFYNWKKTMYPRFMLYKRSYSELLQFTKDVSARNNLGEFKIWLEKNEKTIFKLKTALDEIVKIIRQQKCEYQITNWEKELNTDINPLFYNNYQKALSFLIDYFKVSQILYSKQNKLQNLKEMLILQLQIQACITFNPHFDNQKKKVEEFENLEKQTVEFLLKKAGYEQ